MKAILSDLVAASWIAGLAGAAALHVCIAITLTAGTGWVGVEQAFATFGGALILTLFGLPISIPSFLIVGSLLGPTTYTAMERLGFTGPIHGLVVGAVLGVAVGLVLSFLVGGEANAIYGLILAVPTAIAGWTFQRTLRAMLPKPPPAPPA